MEKVASSIAIYIAKGKFLETSYCKWHMPACMLPNWVQLLIGLGDCEDSDKDNNFLLYQAYLSLQVLMGWCSIGISFTKTANKVMKFQKFYQHHNNT